MKFIKTFENYIDGEIEYRFYESLSIFENTLLESINAEEVDMYTEFKIPRNEFGGHVDIDTLDKSVVFINSLSSIGLKKSHVENSDDYATFINKSCKFMMIYYIESSELENPIFILFQIWNDTFSKWEDAKLYKVNDDIIKFYNKLSSKIIEIEFEDTKYIYDTSNGNEWILQNLDKENDLFKKYLRKSDIEEIAKNNELKINII